MPLAAARAGQSGKTGKVRKWIGSYRHKAAPGWALIFWPRRLQYIGIPSYFGIGGSNIGIRASNPAAGTWKNCNSKKYWFRCCRRPGGTNWGHFRSFSVCGGPNVQNLFLTSMGLFSHLADPIPIVAKCFHKFSSGIFCIPFLQVCRTTGQGGGGDLATSC